MVVILCYHKISDIRNDYNQVNVTPCNFAQQMEYLSKQYQVVSLEHLCVEMYECDECIFAVTFDDGYRDVYHRALPVLERYKVPATAFITTGNLGTDKENWTDNIIRAIFEPANKKDYFACLEGELTGKWYTRDIEERTAFYRKVNYLFRHVSAQRREKYERVLLEWAGLSSQGRRENRVLSVQELRELSQSPLISIGAHTVTHPFLSALTDEEQEWEIAHSIMTLREITGAPVRYIAYPFGSRNSYNATTTALLKKYEIEMAFTTLDEKISVYTDCYQMPRIVMGNYSLTDFESVVCEIISKQKTVGRVDLRRKKRSDFQYYVGSIERDTLLLDEEKRIVVWGCGFWGRHLYDDLKLLRLHRRVVAYGDNDISKVGHTIEHVPVLSKSEIVELNKSEDLAILVKNSHDLEICEDLRKSGFNEIHLIVR